MLLSQFSIILCFMIEYYRGFKEIYEDYWIEERKVLLMVKASLAGLSTEIMASASSVVFDDVDPASDNYRSAVGREERDLVDCKLDDQFFTHLKNNLHDEDPEQYYKKQAEKYIDNNMSKPFSKAQKDRSEFDGPATLGQSLELREDFYAFCFLYQLRRAYFFEQDYYGDDSCCDSELDEAREAEDREDNDAAEAAKEAAEEAAKEAGEQPPAEVPAAGEDAEEDVGAEDYFVQ